MIRFSFPSGRASTRADARLAVTGFTSAAGQALLLRELAVPFDGNEVVTCALLAAWMVLTGAGAAVGALRGRSPFLARKWLPLLLGPALLASVMLARAARGAVAGPGGFTPGFALMTTAAFVVMAPFCLVSGAMFTAMLRGAGRGYHSARGYAVEAAGFLAGGLAASFVLVLLYDDFSSAGFVAFVACAGFALSETKMRPKAALALACAALLVAVVSGVFEKVGRATRALSFPGETLVDTADTRWGNFAVTARGAGDAGAVTFRRNGRWAGDPDQDLFFDEFVHLALLSAQNPRRTLLIGDSLAGGLWRALDHGGRVDCALPDRESSRLILKHVSRRDSSAAFDPRATLLFGDGRRVAASAPGMYDVIVVLESDPLTGATNRYYTAEFFEIARNAMTPEGVLAVNLDSVRGFQGHLRSRLAGSVLGALNRAFRNVKPVWTDNAGVVFLASSSPIESDPEVLAARIAARGIEQGAAKPSWLKHAMAREIPDFGEAPVNSDLRPASYLFAFALRESMFGSASLIPLLALIAVPLMMFAAAAVVFARRNRVFPAVPLASFAGGLAGMAMSASFLLAYQAAAGTIYEHLGALSGAYMAGAAAGALAGRKPSRTALFLAATGAGFAVIGIGAFFGLGPACALGASAWSLPVFMAMQAAAGFLTGALFPLLSKNPGAGGAGGAALVWSSDLAGAAAGAVLAGAVSIPLLGIPTTALLAGLIALGGSIAGATFCWTREAVCDGDRSLLRSPRAEETGHPRR